MTLRDPDIRAALLTRLRTGSTPWFIREEHVLGYGERHSTTADVIAIDDECMHGFEIKSDVDSLARLYPPGGNQVADYSSVCDFVTIVVGQKHTTRAIQAVPSWWTIIAAAESGDGVVFEIYRAGGWNVSPNPIALARLLWAAELAELGRRHGLRRRTYKHELVKWIAATVGLNELRATVRTALRSRDYMRERLVRERAARGAA